MEGGIQAFAERVAAEVAQGEGGAPPERNYRGVSRRRGGKWGADIQEPITHERVWLGTYDTREQAACAYDAASRTLRPHAETHFPEPAGLEETRAAVVRAHVAGVKRKRAEKMQQREAEAAAARGAVPPPVQPPPAAPVPVSDASGSHSAPAPVGASSIRLFGHVLTPAAPPAPAPAANASASQLPPVLAPAPLNFAFPNAMVPPPPFHLVLAPTAPAAWTPQTHLQALRHLREVQASYNRSQAISQDVYRRLEEVQAAGGLGDGSSDTASQE